MNSKIWLSSIGFAILFNLLLFTLMASLVKKKPNIPTFDSLSYNLDFIKIHRANYIKKNIEKNKKQKLKKIKIVKAVKLYSPTPKMITPTLPFEVNPKLPSISNVFVPNLKPKFLPIPELKTHFSIGELDKPLIPILKFPPIYPMYARRMGIEGWVKVKFIVNEHGQVIKVNILDSKPKGIFDSATKRAVYKWKFSPPTVDGEPVKAEVETIIKFKLK